MGKKVLVVDDDKNAVKFMSVMLEENGYEPIVAYDHITQAIEQVGRENISVRRQRRLHAARQHDDPAVTRVAQPLGRLLPGRYRLAQLRRQQRREELAHPQREFEQDPRIDQRDDRAAASTVPPGSGKLLM